jgi:hypothetical protein
LNIGEVRSVHRQVLFHFDLITGKAQRDESF